MTRLTGIIRAYIRVSTGKQNTDRQLFGVEYDVLYPEKISAKNMDRPEFTKLMEDLQPGDTVLVHSLDRLCRNARDLHNTVLLIDERGAYLKSVKEGIDTSANYSIFAKLMISMFAAFAEFERAVMLDRQREAIDLLVSSGKLNKPHLSARTIPDGLEKDVKLLLEQGVSISAISRLLNISRATIYVMRNGKGRWA